MSPLQQQYTSQPLSCTFGGSPKLANTPSFCSGNSSEQDNSFPSSDQEDETIFTMAGKKLPKLVKKHSERRYKKKEWVIRMDRVLSTDLKNHQYNTLSPKESLKSTNIDNIVGCLPTQQSLTYFNTKQDNYCSNDSKDQKSLVNSNVSMDKDLSVTRESNYVIGGDSEVNAQETSNGYLKVKSFYKIYNWLTQVTKGTNNNECDQANNQQISVDGLEGSLESIRTPTFRRRVSSGSSLYTHGVTARVQPNSPYIGSQRHNLSDTTSQVPSYSELRGESKRHGQSSNTSISVKMVELLLIAGTMAIAVGLGVKKWRGRKVL